MQPPDRRTAHKTDTRNPPARRLVPDASHVHGDVPGRAARTRTRNAGRRGRRVRIGVYARRLARVCERVGRNGARTSEFQSQRRTAAKNTHPQAMVYTLALRLKDLIAEMVVRRKERIAREDDERFQREEEVRARMCFPLQPTLPANTIPAGPRSTQEGHGGHEGIVRQVGGPV